MARLLVQHFVHDNDFYYMQGQSQQATIISATKFRDFMEQLKVDKDIASYDDEEIREQLILRAARLVFRVTNESFYAGLLVEDPEKNVLTKSSTFQVAWAQRHELWQEARRSLTETDLQPDHSRHESQPRHGTPLRRKADDELKDVDTEARKRNKIRAPSRDSENNESLASRRKRTPASIDLTLEIDGDNGSLAGKEDKCLTNQFGKRSRRSTCAGFKTCDM